MTCVTHGKPCVTRHAKANACVTHGKPCGHMHVNGHAYKWDMFLEEGGGAGKEKRKGGKERKKENKEKKGKGKEREKEERGKRFLSQFISILMVATR